MRQIVTGKGKTQSELLFTHTHALTQTDNTTCTHTIIYPRLNIYPQKVRIAVSMSLYLYLYAYTRNICFSTYMRLSILLLNPELHHVQTCTHPHITDLFASSNHIPQKIRISLFYVSLYLCISVSMYLCICAISVHVPISVSLRLYICIPYPASLYRCYMCTCTYLCISVSVSLYSMSLNISVSLYLCYTCTCSYLCISVSPSYLYLCRIYVFNFDDHI